MYFPIQISTLTTLGITLLTTTTAATQCYWPNAKHDDNYLPCPGRKSCCLKGEACLSNGLCYGAKLNVAYRGACTDPSWPTDDCPNVCTDVIDNMWANLYACPEANSPFNMTCGKAAQASVVCQEQAGWWMWSNGTVDIAQNGVSESSSSSSSTSTSTSNSSSMAASSATGSESEPGISSTSTASEFSSPTNSDTSPSGDTSKTNANSSAPSALTLGVGLGVGLGVPLLLVTTVLVLACIRIKRRDRSATMAGTIMEGSGYRAESKACGVAEIDTQRHNETSELDGRHRSQRSQRAELYG